MHTKRGENIAAKIARIFTYNRPLSILVLVGVIVLGITSYVFTPKQYNPEITRPAFEVSVEYPGANAKEVNSLVTQELVEKIGDIEGVDEIRARSEDGGRSSAMVIFDVGYDLQNAKIKLFTQLEENLHFARGNIKEPVIKNVNTDDVPILTIGFTSPSLSQNEIRKKAIPVMNELKKLPRVANLSLHGGEAPALSVSIDTQAAKSRNVSIGEILNAIKASNLKYKTKGIKDGRKITEFEVNGKIKDAEDAKDIVVAKGVFLSDVAKVTSGYTEKDSFVYFSGEDGEKPAVYLSVAKKAGTNAPSVSSAIKNKLSNILSEDAYSGISAQVLRDDGVVADKAVMGLVYNLLLGIAIVGFILVLFLSWRPALVVMTAIPMTLLLVFFVGLLFDQTINRITLFALILSLGLLVDSATVVVENIYRHFQVEQEDKQKAVIHAVHQIGMGLILSTITSMVVFFPVSYITGMMGPYMGPIAFFVPVALLMSLMVAFMITPFLSYTVLKEEDRAQTSPIQKMFEKVTDAYTRTLRKVLYNRKLQKQIVIGFFTALIVVMSFPVLKLVHFKMLPQADKRHFYVYVDMPNGTDVLKTRNLAQEIQQTLKLSRYTTSIQSFVGTPPVIDFNGLFKGAYNRKMSHHATLRVNLTEPDQRSKNSSEIVSDLRKLVETKVDTAEDTSVRFVEVPPGPPVKAPFVAQVKGEDREVRQRLARATEQALTATKGTVDIDTSIEEVYPRIIAEVDKQKAHVHGISSVQVAEMLGVVLGPLEKGQYYGGNSKEYSPIEVSVPREKRDDPSDIENINIKNKQGEMMPLSSVVSYRYSRNIPTIRSKDFRPLTTVTAKMEDRSIVYGVIDTMKKMADYKDAEGEITSWDLFGLTYTTDNGDDYRIAMEGEWEMTLENFRDLGLAMIVAFFLVYTILVAKYRSFLMPALIMVTVLFSFVGIMPGFAVLDVINGTFLTATALIGLIALIGIVVNNAILYLEYFTELKEEHGYTDDREAFIEAGRMRIRPIILTSLTTILATVIMAFDPVWAGLAWSVVFGLSLSAIMTLGIFPILYIWIIGKMEKSTDF